MGASSVTGVGNGSVEGKNQGSKHWTVGVGRLLGPKIMAADVVTLVSGTASVILPKLSGNASDYIVIATDSDATAAAANASLAFGANDCTLTVKGTGTHVIQWAIVKKGLTT